MLFFFPFFKLSASVSPLGSRGSFNVLSPYTGKEGDSSFVLSVKGQSKGDFFRPGPVGADFSLPFGTEIFIFADFSSSVDPFDYKREESIGTGLKGIFLREGKKIPAIGGGLIAKNLQGSPDIQIAGLFSKTSSIGEFVLNAGYNYQGNPEISQHHYGKISLLWRKFLHFKWEVFGDFAGFFSSKNIYYLTAGVQFFISKNFSLVFSLIGNARGGEKNGLLLFTLAFRSNDEREIDTDGDGILDAHDNCIFEKEDHDGFEDRDGCPDPDNDKDGIPDHLDPTPNGETIEFRYLTPYPKFPVKLK